MLVCCTSDLHGALPEIPDCDLLLIGGDLCGPSHPELQKDFLNWNFRKWLEKLVNRDITVVGIEGNHAIFAKQQPNLFRELMDSLPWFYLQDETLVLDTPNYVNSAIKIFGTPGSLPFGDDWAFNYTESKMTEIFSRVWEDTDIIISHGPPYGIGDVPGY